jgi:DNA modification methylase
VAGAEAVGTQPRKTRRVNQPALSQPAYVNDPDFTLYVGDALDVLRELPDGSVHCVVTSPPYFGLRDYGTGTWENGDPDCDHVAGPARGDQDRETPGGRGGSFRGGTMQYAITCGKCSARRVDQQLGLEPLHDCNGWATRDRCGKCYVCRMTTVFRQVRRVLRDDGTCWLNIGDSYAGGAITGEPRPGTQRADGKRSANSPRNRNGIGAIPNCKQKDLIGVPWRLALSLQADGWYLRSDIIWAKPNPMPESVTDRPTKAHEYVFLLSKSPRYFFDQEAVREPFSGGTHSRGSQIPRETPKNAEPGSGIKNNRSMGKAIWKQAAVPPPQEETLGDLEGESPRGPDGRRNTHIAGGDGSLQHRDGDRWPGTARNVRSVWEIATQPYPEAHFATFPVALAERCIQAGCPENGTVLDPFMGSGTVAVAARKHGRNSIGIELNPDYAELAARRTSQLSVLAG